MGKKKDTKVHIQGPLIFKDITPSQVEKKDEYSVEKINQEDDIIFINNLNPQANRYQYSIILKNNSSFPISDVKIEVISPKFLTYSGCYPKTVDITPFADNSEDNLNSFKITLGKLRENNSKEIHLHFIPNTLHATAEFKSILTYINHKEKLKNLKSKPIELQVDQIIISPKVILSSEIREFSQSPGNKRILYSLGIGTTKKIDTTKILDDMKNFFQYHSFQLITKDTDRGILWFCGTDIRSSSDILILCRIGSNQIEVIVFSKKPIILVPFLFSFSKIIQERLSKHKVINPKKNLYELICVNCGSVLSYFPRKGESIICNKCNYDQIVW
ncbi:MAG: hypothetical protein ACXAEX_01155 [Promethearchaeota archaeon]|jgi:hypothetical protein